MLQRTAYWLSQNARVGWFLAQYMVAQRIDRTGAPRRPSRERTAGPGLWDLLADLRILLARDLKNIEEGHYALPHDLVGNPRELVQSAWRYFADVPAVVARRHNNAFDEVTRTRPDGLSRFPEYYRRNF